jgi:membrane-bound inhibitor of C-type lysozyme
MKKPFVWLIIGVIVIFIGIAVYGASRHYVIPESSVATSTATSTQQASSNNVSFACSAGKTIEADFASNQVTLSLSDGRSFTLPQVMSGSGIRYKNASDTIEFDSEGSNAMLTEATSTTYNNCIAASVGSAGNGTDSFTDQSKTFSFNYPSSFVLSGGETGYTQDWSQEATTSGLVLAVVSTPDNYQPKTNFGDAKFTVGTSADPQAVSSCTTTTYGSMGSSTQVIINSVPYTKITFSDAGAGNLYQTTSYRTVRNSQCYAVEYTIHSSNIGNYSPDQGITPFDQTSIQNSLESIVQSFKFL